MECDDLSKSQTLKKEHRQMIRVMLVDMRGEKSYIECQRVPPGRDGISTGGMMATISAEYAREVAHEVAQGYMSGFVAGYHWYRQAG